MRMRIAGVFFVATVCLASEHARADDCLSDYSTEEPCIDPELINSQYRCPEPGDCHAGYHWMCVDPPYWHRQCIPAHYQAGLSYTDCALMTCEPPECAPGTHAVCDISGVSCGSKLCQEDSTWGECEATSSCDDSPAEGDDGGSNGGSNGQSGGSGPGTPDPGGCRYHGNPVDIITGFTGYRSVHDDVVLETEVGPIQLGRFYNTRVALSDFTRAFYLQPLYIVSGLNRTAALYNRPNRLGMGWSHKYSYSLIWHAVSSAASSVTFVRPDRSTETFDSVTTSFVMLSNGDRIRRLSDGGWEVHLGDGTILIFSSITDLTSPSSVFAGYLPISSEVVDGIGELRELTLPTRQHLTLGYYGEEATGACSATTDGPLGALCRVTDDFGDYLRLVYNSDLLTGVYFAGPSGVEYTTSYGYTLTSLTTSDGFDSGVAISYLSGVTYTDGNYETYVYGSSTYNRPDLNYSVGSITYDFNTRPRLLTRALGYGNYMLGGHEYDTQGRAVASLRPGELLRFEYETLSSSESRVLIFNESTGTQAEYAITDRVITDVSNQCSSTCSLAPASYEVDSGNNIVGKTDMQPSSSEVGTHTTFGRDSSQRVTLIQENWSGSASTLATVVDNPSSPVRVAAYTYVSGTTHVASKSPVYSVACASASSFELSCSATSFQPMIEYDYDTDYDSDFNENPGELVTQIRETGLTTTNLTTGTVAAQARVTQNFYDSFGRTTSVVKSDGTSNLLTITYDFYGATSDASAYRRSQRSINGEAVQEIDSYVDFGRPSSITDPRSGMQKLMSYYGDGSLYTSTLSDGSITFSEQFLYVATNGAVATHYYGNNADYFTFFGGDATIVGWGSTDFCSFVSSTSAADCVNSLAWYRSPVTYQHQYGGGLIAQHQFTFDTSGNVVLASTYDYNNVLRRQRGASFDEQHRNIRRFSYTDDPANPAYVRETYRDALGRITAIAEPNVANVSSSHAGNESIANVQYEYDALNRVTSVTRGGNPTTQRTTYYEYDGHDNLSSMTDSDGRTTSYLYNDFGELIAVSSPDSGITAYRYDALGRLVESIYSDGRSTQLTYDWRGHIASRIATNGGDSVSIIYHYDALTGSSATNNTSCMTNDNAFNVDETQLTGRVAWIAFDWGVRYYSYTAFGRVAAIYEQDGGTFDVCALRITRYSYDAAGHVTSTTYPSGMIATADFAQRERGAYISLSYTGGSMQLTNDDLSDVDGRPLSSRLNLLIDFNASYDLSGNFVTRTYADDATLTPLFDWTVDSDSDGSITSYERDGNGNILTVLDRVSADGFYSTMSEFDELVTYARPTGSTAECSYTYDNGGNRLSESCADRAASYAYEAGSSRLSTVTWSAVPSTCSASLPVSVSMYSNDAGAVTQYAKNGCPATTATIQYDAAGRVSSFNYDSSTAITYDERGQARTMGTGRHLTYDRSGRVLTDETGDAITEYVWAGSDLIAVVSTAPPAGPVVHVVATDHLGAPWRAWDASTGDASWSVSYEPFGRVTPEDGATSNLPTPVIAQRRPGQLADRSSGLYQNWWRHLDVESSRFTAADPMVAAAPGHNEPTFSAVANDPLIFVDPTGLYIFVGCADDQQLLDHAAKHNPAINDLLGALKDDPNNHLFFNYFDEPDDLFQRGGAGVKCVDGGCSVNVNGDMTGAYGYTPDEATRHELGHAYDYYTGQDDYTKEDTSDDWQSN